MSRLNANRLILAAFSFFLLLIPLTSYLMLQRAKFEKPLDSQFSSPTSSFMPQTTLPSTGTSAIEEIKNNIASLPSATPGFIMQGEPAVLSAEATPAGMQLKLSTTDRPIHNQSNKVFIGIGSGPAIPNPKYILSFLINTDQNGEYSGISLTGLDEGSSYTAYIKGVSYLATTREFTFHDGLIDLGLIPLISGDINEDNTVNQDDLLMVKQNIGKNPNISPEVDVNKDDVINSLDLAIVTQNLGKSGEVGISVPNQIDEATASASLQTSMDTGTPEASSSARSGYWLWIPKVD